MVGGSASGAVASAQTLGKISSNMRQREIQEAGERKEEEDAPRTCFQRKYRPLEFLRAVLAVSTQDSNGGNDEDGSRKEEGNTLFGCQPTSKGPCTAGVDSTGLCTDDLRSC